MTSLPSELCSSKRRQNALTSAIKEYGALRRTVCAARYLADETTGAGSPASSTRARTLHALRRSLAYAGEGAIRRRHHEQQTEQMWCLTVATNAIVCWSTEYHGLGVAALRRDGRDIDGEPAQLDADGYRPLRLPSEAITAGR